MHGNVISKFMLQSDIVEMPVQYLDCTFSSMEMRDCLTHY